MVALLLAGPLALVRAVLVISPVSGSTTTWALNPSWGRSRDLWACRASGSTVEIIRSGATWRAMRHRPSVPSEPSAGSTSWPATSASNATASAARASSPWPSGWRASIPASTASASPTSAETSSSRAAGSSQAIWGLPGRE